MMGVVRSAEYVDDNAVLRGRSVEQVTSDGKIAQSSCFLDSNGVLRQRSQRPDGKVRVHSAYLDGNGVRRWRTAESLVPTVECSDTVGGIRVVVPKFLEIAFPCQIGATLFRPTTGETLEVGGRITEIALHLPFPAAPIEVAELGSCHNGIASYGRVSLSLSLSDATRLLVAFHLGGWETFRPTAVSLTVAAYGTFVGYRTVPVVDGVARVDPNGLLVPFSVYNSDIMTVNAEPIMVTTSIGPLSTASRGFFGRVAYAHDPLVLERGGLTVAC